MTRRLFKTTNTKLNFLWRQSNYLNYSSSILLCNVLTQPHFGYGHLSWYPLLSKASKTKLQIAQNKYIHFCLELLPRGHISPSHFRKIIWLAVERRVELCTSTSVFKYWKGIAKTAATTASFMQGFEKKKFLINYKSEQFHSFFDSCLLLFYHIYWRSYLQGYPNGNKNYFGSSLSHPCDLQSSSMFWFMFFF